jgi:transcriptional regulator with XRE-family HTH domain
MRFGERLRALRRDQGRTLWSVCKSVRMSVGYLSKIETGTNLPPSAKLIRRLCSALGCKAELPEMLELASESREQLEGTGHFQGMHFGKRLRTLRRERGRTLKAVSDAVRVSPTYLTEIETGKINPPNPNVIKQLCSALDCDAELPKLVELANGFRVQEAFVLRTNLHTAPEVKQMMGLLRQSHVAGELTPASALAIVNILRGQSTAS